MATPVLINTQGYDTLCITFFIYSVHSLQDYFDFTSPVEGSLSKPVCGQGEPQAEDSALDLLGSLIRADISPGLDYSAEVGLQETLQMLGSGQGEPVDVVGTRIARAQEKVCYSKHAAQVFLLIVKVNTHPR